MGTASARARAAQLVEAEIAAAIAGGHNFGIESTFANETGRALVEPAVQADQDDCRAPFRTRAAATLAESSPAAGWVPVVFPPLAERLSVPPHLADNPRFVRPRL